MSFCLLEEKSLCLRTSYKTKDVFIRSSYYYYREKPAWDVESHSLQVKVSDFAPFVVRTRGNSSKQNYKNNLCTQFAGEDAGLWPFYNSYVKKRKLFTRKFSQTI